MISFYLLLRRSISDHYLRSSGYVTCSRPQRTATGGLEPGTSRPKFLGFTTAPVRSVIEKCDQIAKFYFHTSCYTHQINFLQYLALRILFAMWVMYSLGHLLWRQDKLWLIIGKCSYIENNFSQNSFRFTHNKDL